MQLVIQTLLLLVLFINHHCIYADHVSADIQHLIENDIHQEPLREEELLQTAESLRSAEESLRSTSPQIPFAGQVPLTADRLIELVRKDYADSLPSNLHPSGVLDDVRGELYWWGKSAPLSWVFQVDVRVPTQISCQPKIRGVKPLAQEIACNNENGCSVPVKFAVAETYQASKGSRMETTVGHSAGARSVEASFSRTNEQTWQKTWNTSNEREVQHTWFLGNNQRCIPSMAHVELECTAAFDVYFYDSYFRRPQDFTDLEYRDQYRRGGGPYGQGQWCFKQIVSQTPLGVTRDWHEVLPNDGFDGNRGDLWRRPGSEMNRHKLGSGGFTFTDNHIVIRRQRGSGGDMREVFGCRRVHQRRSGNIMVPLSSDSGSLEGYVGCVLTW